MPGKLKYPRARIVSVFVILMLLVIIMWAGQRTNAARHFLAAQTILNDMLEADQINQAGIDEALERIRLALRTFPGQPDYQDFAGQLHELMADREGVVGQQRSDLLETAAGHYRKALSVRPLWPYSWVNLLSVKDKLGQVDMEFNKALHRAVETGPWEPRLQLAVITTGLRRWDRLRRTERNLIREEIIKSLKTQPREVFMIARTFNRPDLVCDEGSDFAQIKQWCAMAL